MLLKNKICTIVSRLLGMALRCFFEKGGLCPLGVKPHFEQNFSTGSYGIGIWNSWYSLETCEIFDALIQH